MGIVNTLLSQLAPGDVDADRYERFLAFLVCKNLYDFVETCEAIINDLKRSGGDVSQFPNEFTFKLAKQTLRSFYSEQMFKTSAAGQIEPNWDAVENFSKSDGDCCYKFVNVLKRNMEQCSIAQNIVNAIKIRDKYFFYNNFDQIFVNVPDILTSYFTQCKSLILNEQIAKDDQEILWEFFGELMHMFMNRDSIIQSFK